jgi:hypothetical protein
MDASREGAGGKPDWAEIRRAYEAPGQSVKAICAAFGVASWTLHDRVKAEGWTVRKPRRKGRERLVERLFLVLERQVKEVEARMSARNGIPVDDKEAKLLDSLARTLGKLMELDASEKARTGGQPSRDLRAAREKLVERIDQLKR